MSHTIFVKLFRSAGAGAGMPINKGTGASNNSLRESGTIGSNTCGQISGLISSLSASLNIPYTIDVISARLQLTTTIDFSSRIATQIQKKSSNRSSENIGVQSHTFSIICRSAGKA